MAIEFRCPNCQKLLRTGDDTAGRQAKCPQCGTITTIPAAGVGPGGSPPPPSPPPASTPFGSAGPQTPRPAGPVNPYQSPQPFTPLDQNRTPGAITPSLLDLGDVFRRTWSIFKKEWGLCLAAVVVVFVIRTVFSYAVGYVFGILGARSHNEAIQIMFLIVDNVTTQAFSLWIGIGQAVFFLKIARGQKPEMSEIFNGGALFIPVLLASLLFGLICGLGILALIVPGIIFAMMFSQYYYLILDRNMGVIDSLTTSKTLMDGNKMTLFTIGLLSMLLSIAAAIPCGLGLLIAVPYFTLMSPVIYLTVTGQPTADVFDSP